MITKYEKTDEYLLIEGEFNASLSDSTVIIEDFIFSAGRSCKKTNSRIRSRTAKKEEPI